MADITEALKHRMTNALLDNQYEEDEIERKANMYDFYRKEYVDVLVEVLAQPPTDQPAAGVEAIAQHIENHSCVSTCCDAQPSAGEAKALADCVRKNMRPHSVPCAAQETPKCTHNNIRTGYDRKYDISWCDDCGVITSCSDGVIPIDCVQRSDRRKWCEARVLAFGCEAEAKGRSSSIQDGKLCDYWCGQSSCSVSIRPAYSIADLLRDPDEDSMPTPHSVPCAAQETPPTGYTIPDDCSRAIAKLLAKLDDEDKNTFNWLMDARVHALRYTHPADSNKGGQHD